MRPLAGVLSADQRLWQNYRGRFVMFDGRVIDNVNGRITHSESQGYGMLLALAANDRETFDRIWAFTRETFLVRQDGLAAWLFKPSADDGMSLETVSNGKIADLNNATDGDILIAWALAEAAAAGYGDEYEDAARKIASAIEENAMFSFSDFGLQIKPGVEGFSVGERGGRPVINLSYWVFPAFQRLSALTQSSNWRSVFDSGWNYFHHVKQFEAALPPDWMSLDSRSNSVRTAPGMDNDYSYNAIRVPLYLAMLGPVSSQALEASFSHWFELDGTLHTIDVQSGQLVKPLQDKGYEAIRSLYHCATASKKPDSKFWTRLDENYYPATIQMLAAASMRRDYPKCS